MTDISLRIEQPDGSVRGTLDAVTGSWRRSLDEQAHASVRVFRENYASIESNIDERNDVLSVVVDGVDEFAGRFDDAQSEGATVRVRVNSPEADALDAEPSGANLTYENKDPEVIAADAIDAVPTLTKGTISLSKGTVSYTVSHGARSKTLADLRAVAGAEIRYNADFSVDVVDELGVSRPITLGPAAGNLGEDFKKTVDEREDVTHVRGLGGQSGPEQVTATAVAPSYSGGREVWREYSNKEIINQSRLQEIIDELVAEYDGEPRALDVDVTVYGEGINLGDRVTVDYPSENISRVLRAVSVETSVTRDGREQAVTLSNRSLTRTSRERKRNDDLERFNSGHGGFIDRDQVTSGWNPAGDGVAQTLEIPNWPDDIVREDLVELTVQGRAWRSPVNATGHTHAVDVTHPSHTHDVTHPSHTHDVTHPSHTHDVTHPSHTHDISTTAANNTNFDTTSVASTNTAKDTVPSDTSWITLDSVSTNATTSFLLATASVRNDDTNGSKFIAVRYYNATDGRYIPNSSGIITKLAEGNIATFGPFLDATNVTLDTLELQARHIFSQSNSTDIEYSSSFLGAGLHTHDVSDTSTAELGTTETSTSALGTNETSTSALGTNETSTSALGTTTSETSDSETDLQPGIIESFDGNSYYPAGVEVAINGSTVTTLSGNSSADWQTTIDLSGQLSAGANTITATPTSQRGELNVILSSELFRRGKTTP